VLRFRRGGRKRGIDGGDLLRVDGELAAEAVAAGTSELTRNPAASRKSVCTPSMA